MTKRLLPVLLVALLLVAACVIAPPQTKSSLLTVIDGEEDTSTNLIHVLALNLTRPVSNYIQQTVQGRIDEINAQGGLAIIAHPNETAYTSEAGLKALKGYLGMEVYFRWGDDALAKWDAVLTDRVMSGEPLVWGLMTDDAHKIDELGKGYIMLRAPEPTKGNVLEALREGSFYWGNAPMIGDISLSDKTITISLYDEMRIKFVKQGSQVIKTVTSSSAQYTVNGNEGYVRVEIRSPDGKRAGTQPFRVIDASNISNPYAIPGKWYKGNLHCHTTNSDGKLSPSEVVKWYEENGYSFLAITDHVRWRVPDGSPVKTSAAVP